MRELFYLTELDGNKIAIIKGSVVLARGTSNGVTQVFWEEQGYTQPLGSSVLQVLQVKESIETIINRNNH